MLTIMPMCTFFSSASLFFLFRRFISNLFSGVLFLKGLKKAYYYKLSMKFILKKISC